VTLPKLSDLVELAGGQIAANQVADIFGHVPCQKVRSRSLNGAPSSCGL
jgi:hypothetical protein